MKARLSRAGYNELLACVFRLASGSYLSTLALAFV
jgi:hypothetical protein